MGRPMARHLVQAGHDVAVWSHTQSKAKKIGDSIQATVCATPAEVAKNKECVFVCLGDTAMSREVILGKDGLVQGASPGLAVVDCSTISPSESCPIAEELHKRKIEFLGAPCSGSKAGAETGTLTFMIGGEKNVFERLRPYFESMGKTLYYCGQLCGRPFPGEGEATGDRLNLDRARGSTCGPPPHAGETDREVAAKLQRRSFSSDVKKRILEETARVSSSKQPLQTLLSPSRTGFRPEMWSSHCSCLKSDHLHRSKRDTLRSIHHRQLRSWMINNFFGVRIPVKAFGRPIRLGGHDTRNGMRKTMVDGRIRLASGAHSH